MSRINLDLIEVPSPCTVPWDSMQGDDKVRHCGQCQQNVYHLSKLSKKEAERLILAKEGKLCVQFYRRPDGSVVTRDCAAVRWWRELVSGVTLVCMWLLALLGVTSAMQSGPANSTFGGFPGSSIKVPAGGGGSCPSESTSVQPTAMEVAPPPATPGAGAAKP